MRTLKTAYLAFALALPASAYAYDLKSGDQDYGTLDMQVKVNGVASAKDNGFDPNDGAAYLLKGKYITPKANGFSAAAGVYVNGDLFGLTDWDTERVARGLFVDDNGDDTAQLTEIYARYDSDKFNVFGGRMLLDTPLTKNAYSTIPNAYTAFGAGFTPMDKLSLGLTQITEMSFGARAMADFGLIGEATKTGGAAIMPSSIGQAEFHKISTVTFGDNADSTDGITAFSASYGGFKNLQLNFWDYYVHDISNNIYFDAGLKIPMDKLTANLAFQYLDQSDVGDSMAGDLDFQMFGLKAGIGDKRWSLWAAFNGSSGDTGFLNAYGGDPAYTSTIFSRNAYRQNVDAWGLGFKYKIMPGLVFVAKYTDYGQSDTKGYGGRAASQTDADETDLILTWKPKQLKGMMLRTYYVNRTSEYDGAGGVDRTQSHWRIIAAYNF